MGIFKRIMKELFPTRYMTDEEKAESEAKLKAEIDKIKYEARYGVLNPKLKCQHCDSVGSVHWKRELKKTGISGGKATAALLTGGISLVGTGLSKREGVNKFYCSNCEMSWE